LYFATRSAAAKRTSFDLTGTGCHQIGNRGVFGFTGAMADYRPKPLQVAMSIVSKVSVREPICLIKWRYQLLVGCLL